MSVLVDTHCHVDLYRDPAAVLRAAAAADVVTIAVTELPSAFQRLELTLRGAPRLRLALGVHPLRAGGVADSELRSFSRLLELTSYVGEIGLDYSARGLSSRRRQIEVFASLLSEPGIGSKILSVHTRRAESDCIARLRQVHAHAILHWYSGSVKELDVALAAGMYFSVNSAMLLSHNGRRILDAIPIDRVLAETDGPYTRVSGRTAEPKDIPWLVAQLAARWRIPPESAGSRLGENFQALENAITRRWPPAFRSQLFTA